MTRPLLCLGVTVLLAATGCGVKAQDRTGTPPSGDAAPALPQPDLRYTAREGRALYRHYCATCHGAEGHGDGFNAYNLDPKPRDLADPDFQAKRGDDDLAAIIRSGGGVAGMSTGMPPWGRTLNERRIRSIIDYLRTLRYAPE